jgi:hypothetical protein
LIFQDDYDFARVQSLFTLRKEWEDYEKIHKLSADERFAVLE